jgi:A/G-specific adenine glycosylase
MTTDPFAAAVMRWYRLHARDLPWRAPGVSAWGVLVSEVMLQQTPAARVAPVWQRWLARWPTPSALALEPAGEAVREWGRLGYPRRALRLHQAALTIDDRHDGAVPADHDALLALPGVGSYTACAVATFGFGGRHGVLDTNVRRVYARQFGGTADAMTAAPTVAERAAALERVPLTDPARYGVAVMELGATVCTARSPRCDRCPVAASCRWLAAGRPAGASARRAQPFAGTDRQVRGRLLGVLRDAEGPVARAALDAVWQEPEQRDRCLAGLLADGLVEPAGAGRYRLPA